MKQNDILTREIQIKAYSKHELVDLYKVSWKVIKVWLEPYEEEIGKRIGHFYTPKQTKIILEKLGVPELVEIKNFV
jgi:hypothetical protein